MLTVWAAIYIENKWTFLAKIKQESKLKARFVQNSWHRIAQEKSMK